MCYVRYAISYLLQNLALSRYNMQWNVSSFSFECCQKTTIGLQNNLLTNLRSYQIPTYLLVQHSHHVNGLKKTTKTWELSMLTCYWRIVGWLDFLRSRCRFDMWCKIGHWLTFIKTIFRFDEYPSLTKIWLPLQASAANSAKSVTLTGLWDLGSR